MCGPASRPERRCPGRSDRGRAGVCAGGASFPPSPGFRMACLPPAPVPQEACLGQVPQPPRAGEAWAASQLSVLRSYLTCRLAPALLCWLLEQSWEPRGEPGSPFWASMGEWCAQSM